MLFYGAAALAALATLIYGIFFWAGGWFWLPIAFVVSFLVVILVAVVVCAICAAAVDFDKPCEEHSPLYRFFANCVIESVQQLLRIRLHVTGMEMLPEEKFLFVSNHRGALDPMLTMGVLRKYHIGFVAKQELFQIPIIGKLMHKSFCLSLNRGSLKEEAKTILRAIKLVKEQKATIGIYPEGTRNHGDGLLPFKNGAFKIAERAQCPIVVAVIRNTELATKRAPFHATDVYLDFIGVLDKEFVTTHNTMEVGAQVRSMMEAFLADHPLGQQ